MDEPHICLLSPYPPQVGGLADYSAKLVQYLASGGVDVRVARPLRLGKRPPMEGWKPYAPYNLCRLLRRERGMIHLQTSILDCLPFTPLDLGILNRPLVITLHELLVVGKSRMYSRSGIGIGVLLRKAISIAQQQLAETADVVVVHNEYTRSRVLEEMPNCSPKLRVIPHGAEVNVIPKHDYSGTGRIVFWGTIVPHKRLDILFSAVGKVAKEHPSVNLVVVGDLHSPLPSAQRMIAHLLKILRDPTIGPRVHLTGYLEMGEIERLLATADVVVLPYQELNVSGVAAKTMAYGVPILTSDHPGFGDLITHGQTGVLFHVGDEEDLARKIVDILSSEDLRGKVGRNARRFAETYLDWQKIARAHIRLYEELCG